MPLIIPSDLPAAQWLEEERIFTMDQQRALTQDIRPLRVAILNLMPTKEVTEMQFLRLLSNTSIQVNIDLVRTQSYTSKNTDSLHLHTFYKTFDEIKNDYYDALIITGAPVEKMNFEDIAYWPELVEILEFAKTNVFSTMFVCWAAQAALYYYYDIPKYECDSKIFGVFDYQVLNKSRLTKGFDNTFYTPQSRYTLNSQADLAAVEDLKVIASREDTGVHLASTQDDRFIFVSGHWEYDEETLENEYLRDRKQGLQPTLPINYYKDDDDTNPIVIRWRAHGNLFFYNWLNYCVYQDTPYDLTQITAKKV